MFFRKLRDPCEMFEITKANIAWMIVSIIFVAPSSPMLLEELSPGKGFVFIFSYLPLSEEMFDYPAICMQSIQIRANRKQNHCSVRKNCGWCLTRDYLQCFFFLWQTTHSHKFVLFMRSYSAVSFIFVLVRYLNSSAFTEQHKLQ